MTFSTNDYTSDTDEAPWTAAPPASHMVAASRNGQVIPAHSHAPIIVSPSAGSNTQEMLMLGSMLQSVQQAQTQQTQLLRDFDARLARLENSAHPQAPAPTPSFERATWWAIWGLLMLILGGALTVVILLILLNVQFR